MISRPLWGFFAACLFLCASAAANVLEQDGFRVIFHPSDRVHAERAMDVLLETASELEHRLPLGDEPVEVTIAESHVAFRRLAGSYGTHEVGGIARSHQGEIVVKSPDLLEKDYEGILRHELLHVLLARNVNAAVLPRWLNEGLAMELSGEHRWGTIFHVAQMYLNGRILTYPDLQLTLLAFPGEMAFGDAYAQSLSMTWFLQKEIGEDGIYALLDDLDTMAFHEALEKHTGWNVYEFWDAWRRSLWVGALLFTLVTGVSLFQFAAVLLVVGWWRKRRKTQDILEQWEDDEDEPLAPWEVFHEEPYLWEEDDED